MKKYTSFATLLLMWAISGKLIAQSIEDTNPDETAFKYALVEVKPIFPGCEQYSTEEEKNECFVKSLSMHVARNFKYPQYARKNKIEGKIFVSFIVETDGSVSDVKVVRSAHDSLDMAAIEAVKSLNELEPRIIPAQQRGKPVRMSFTIPINARIQ